MSNKKIILLSLIFAIASAVVVLLYMNNLKNAATNIKYQKVVVAKINIPSKTTISNDMLELKNVPGEYINGTAYTKLADVVGKINKYEIISGEQILKAKIVGEKDITQGMSYVIPKGKRAMTISVNQVTGVNGFIRPSDHVDLAVTMEMEVGEQRLKQMVNKIIVQDIEILAVEKVVNQDAQKDKNVDLKTITLLVSVDDTRLIMLANDKGILHLLLRSPTDKEKGTSEPFMPSKFMNP